MMIAFDVSIRRQRLLERVFCASITEIRGLRIFLYLSLDNDAIARVFIKEYKAPPIFQLPTYSINEKEYKHELRNDERLRISCHCFLSIVTFHRAGGERTNRVYEPYLSRGILVTRSSPVVSSPFRGSVRFVELMDPCSYLVLLCLPLHLTMDLPPSSTSLPIPSALLHMI